MEGSYRSWRQAAGQIGSRPGSSEVSTTTPQASGQGEAYTDNIGIRSPIRSLRAASRSRRTLRISSARSRRTKCGFSLDHRSSPSRSGAKAITAMRPTSRAPPSGLTTSRRAPSLCGTWTRSPIVSSSTVAMHPISRELFVRGQMADAEPAVPNWSIAVDAIFA